MSAAPSRHAFSIAASDEDQAVVLARLFIEALNARDAQALAGLVSDDVEFRNAQGGRSLRGRDAVEALVRAAEQARVSLVRRDAEQVLAGGDVTQVAVPVRELAGGAEIDGSALFEVRAGRIAAFEVSSEQLRR